MPTTRRIGAARRVPALVALVAFTVVTPAVPVAADVTAITLSHSTGTESRFSFPTVRASVPGAADGTQVAFEVGGPQNGVLVDGVYLAMAGTPSGNGYWLVTADGRVKTFGDAAFFGDAETTNRELAGDVVAMAATRPGTGTGSPWTTARCWPSALRATSAAPAAPPPSPLPPCSRRPGAAGTTSSTSRARCSLSAAPCTTATPAPSAPPWSTPSRRRRMRYWVVTVDGEVAALGPDLLDGGPPSGNGYWLTAADGGVLAFGGAPYRGSPASAGVNQPVLDIVAVPAGDGYWILGLDGRVYNFGTAGFFGSIYTVPVRGGVATFTFTSLLPGSSTIHARSGVVISNTLTVTWVLPSPGTGLSPATAGSSPSGTWPSRAPTTGALRLNSPIVGMAPALTGNGHWLVASDGGIFNFGDAVLWFHGRRAAQPAHRGMAPTPTGEGYWLVARDGEIFNFGDAVFRGSTGALTLNQPIAGMAAG